MDTGKRIKLVAKLSLVVFIFLLGAAVGSVPVLRARSPQHGASREHRTLGEDPDLRRRQHARRRVLRAEPRSRPARRHPRSTSRTRSSRSRTAGSIRTGASTASGSFARYSRICAPAASSRGRARSRSSSLATSSPCSTCRSRERSRRRSSRSDRGRLLEGRDPRDVLEPDQLRVRRVRGRSRHARVFR